MQARPMMDGQGVHGVSCHWRYLGKPAASGARRIIFTLQTEEDAKRVMLITSKWWAVDNTLDQGFRWCAVRWFRPNGQID